MPDAADLLRPLKVSRGRKIIRVCAFVLATSAVGIAAGRAGEKSVLASQSASFGPIRPSFGTGPATVEIPFRLPVAKSTATSGYRVSANSTFTFTASAQSNQGKSIGAADIQVALVSVVPGGGSSTVVALPSQGGNSSQNSVGSIADLLQGHEMFRVGKASAAAIPDAGTDCYFMLRLVIPTGYFTPGSFSGNITVLLAP